MWEMGERERERERAEKGGGSNGGGEACTSSSVIASMSTFCCDLPLSGAAASPRLTMPGTSSAA